jgi:hypothetical protein
VTYRDDLDAAIARAEGLDQDLESERAENDRLRAELAKAKAPPEPEPPPPPPVVAKPTPAPPREPELPADVDVRLVRAACSPFGFALFYTFNLVTFLLGFLATIPITLAVGEKRGIQPYLLAALPIILISKSSRCHVVTDAVPA